MTNKQKLEAVKKTADSEGWRIVQEEMKKAVVQAAYQLSESPDMAIEEIHFRRGAMWAARKFINMPENIQAILNNEILMDSVHQDERHGPHN